MNVTFFAWGNTRFGEAAKFHGDSRLSTIEQLNNLAGWIYPDASGAIKRPDFVIHCGDILAGDKTEQELALYEYYSRRLFAPHYEVLGRRDQSPAFTTSFTERHRSRTYGFNEDLLFVLLLNVSYGDDGSAFVADEDLAHLERDLAVTEAGTPILLAMHERMGNIRNGDQLQAMLAGHRTALLLCGGEGRSGMVSEESLPCLRSGQVFDPSSASADDRCFHVIRIEDSKVSIYPWRWDEQAWAGEPIHYSY